ncbi:MAG: signal peptidase II [Clostridia bacterium]|nr:signal peptidase II [Clostridia bacterium]
MAVIVSLLSVAVLTAVDQIIKWVVEARLPQAGEVTVLRGFLSWEYVKNTGAAFGSFSKSTTLLSVITAVVLLAGIVAIIMKKIKGKYLLTVSVMIIAGGLGNLIDRIVKGYVVDFIEVRFIDFPVFNFADILVTCGAFMLIGYLIYDTYREYKKKKGGE